MNSIQKASYISSMPYEMFKELLLDKKAALKSLKRADKITMTANNQRPYDKRNGVNEIINDSFLVSCVQNNETILTTKMVSLNIIFNNQLNPEYFDELREICVKKDYDTGKEVIDFTRIASIYKTTTDNVKSYMLLSDYKKNILETTKQKQNLK